MPQTTVRKTYTYGGKKIQKQCCWDNLSEQDSVEAVMTKSTVPKRKGIWANASGSPFKKSPGKTVHSDILNNHSDDPFGFHGDDPYSFDDHIVLSGLKDVTPIKSPKKVSSSKNVTPIKIPKKVSCSKNVTPIKSPKKVYCSPKSPPMSPTSMRPRIFGVPLPQEHITITVDELKTYGSPPKVSRSRKTDCFGPDNRKKDIRPKNNARSRKTKSSNTKLTETESSGLDLSQKEPKIEPEIKVGGQKSKVTQKAKVVKDDSMDQETNISSSQDSSISEPFEKKRVPTKTYIKQSKRLKMDPSEEISVQHEIEIEKETTTDEIEMEVDHEEMELVSDQNGKEGVQDRIENVAVPDKVEKYTLLKSDQINNNKTTKLKPLFSYYDKEKKKNEELKNIYGDTKKVNVMSDSDSELPDSCETVSTCSLDSSASTKRKILSNDTNKQVKVTTDCVVEDQGNGSGICSPVNSDKERHKVKVSDYVRITWSYQLLKAFLWFGTTSLRNNVLARCLYVYLKIHNGFIRVVLSILPHSEII